MPSHWVWAQATISPGQSGGATVNHSLTEPKIWKGRARHLHLREPRRTYPLRSSDRPLAMIQVERGH